MARCVDKVKAVVLKAKAAARSRAYRDKQRKLGNTSFSGTRTSGKRTAASQDLYRQQLNHRRSTDRPAVFDAVMVNAYVRYLSLREAAAFCSDEATATKRPKHFTSVEQYVLANFHFCSNFRQDDRCSREFQLALKANDDPFVLLMSSIILTLLPRWPVYVAFVKKAMHGAACSANVGVFDPRCIKWHTEQQLTAALTSVVQEWQKRHGESIWRNWPYITMAQTGKSKPAQLAAIMLSLQRGGQQLYDALVATGAKATLSPSARATRSYENICKVRDALPGFGWFLSYQALISASSLQLSHGVFFYDASEHGVLGNGAAKGGRLLWKRFPSATCSAVGIKRHVLALKRVHRLTSAKCKLVFGKRVKLFNLQSVEHTLCEFAKFANAVSWFCRKWSITCPYQTSCVAPRRRRVKKMHLKRSVLP